MDFLYWFRENPKRDLQVDVDWALARFNVKFKNPPTEILVNPEQYGEFKDLNLTLNLIEDKRIQKRYFGLR